MRFRSQIWLAALLVLAMSGCRRGGQEQAAAPPPVTVQHPVMNSVNEYLDLTGTVGASKSVQLMARVAGFLESLNFKDGSYVEKDQILFVIEPEQYVQQVKLNEASLVQNQLEYDRQMGMITNQATSKSNVEKWRSNRDQAKAQLELAKINLGYTKVTAPFAGRIGARQVDPGNLVGANGPTLLATIEQLVPIYVNFNLNERDALALHTVMRKMGLDVKAEMGKAKVEVGLPNEEGYPHEGVLDFVDNEISSSSGTIALRGVLPNTDKALFPGLFARVRIPMGDPTTMAVIPKAAIGNDQQGDYVLVVGNGDVVERRSVVKGPGTADGIAIRSGLTANDRVIVNGLLNARPRDKVTPTLTTPAAPAAKP